MPSPEDECIISIKNPPEDDQFEWSLAPFSHFPDMGKPILYMRVERNPSYFLATIMLPTFIVVLLAQGSLFIRGDGGGDDNHTRFNTFMLSLLTVAAYKSSIQSFLPKKSYLTLADLYILAAFMFHGLCVVKILAIISRHGKGQAGLFDGTHGGAEGDNTGISMSDEGDITGLSMSDDYSTWGLIALWIVFHAVFAVDHCLGFRLGERIGLRKRWARLLTDRAHKDSDGCWCLGVNCAPRDPESSSFRCGMFSLCCFGCCWIHSLIFTRMCRCCGLQNKKVTE